MMLQGHLSAGWSMLGFFAALSQVHFVIPSPWSEAISRSADLTVLRYPVRCSLHLHLLATQRCSRSSSRCLHSRYVPRSLESFFSILCRKWLIGRNSIDLPGCCRGPVHWCAGSGCCNTVLRREVGEIDAPNSSPQAWRMSRPPRLTTLRSSPRISKRRRTPPRRTRCVHTFRT